MTTSAVTPRVSYNGSGSTGPFSIPFLWTTSSELVVTRTSTTGVESTLAVTTHFTLTGANTSSGSLTLITTLAVGETLTIERATTQTQSVDLVRSYLDFNVLEGALDKLTRSTQDLWFRVGRTLQLYKDDAVGSGAFNVGGQRISNLAPGVAGTDAATVSQVEGISGSIQIAEDAADAAATSAAQAAFYAALAEGVAASSILPNTFALSGDVTPPQITATQNNYDPSGWSTASVLRLSSDASRDITGLAGGTDGRFAFIHNVGTNQIILKSEDAGSTAANRFSLPRDTALAPSQCSFFQYDATASRWKMIGGNANRMIVATSAPANPAPGDLWFDSSLEILNIWGGSSWLDVSTLTTPGPNSLTNAELAQMPALSVKGNATNATANASDIAAASDGHVLRRSGTSLGFGTVAAGGITDGAVTNAKLANMATSRLKGRVAAGTGAVEDLTPEQAHLVLNISPEEENRIINGAFNIWQRGSNSSTAGYQTADRWRNTFVGGTSNFSRQSFAVGTILGRNTPTFHLRHDVSGQSLASHRAVVGHRIEGVSTYAGQTITVLGWAKRNSGAGNMVVEFEQQYGTGGSPSAANSVSGPVTVTLTGSWAPFAATINIPSISGKTIGTDGNDYLGMNIWTSAGSDNAARTNSLGIQTIAVDLWGIHIRVGTHTADAVNYYMAPPVGDDLRRCQRYHTRFPFGIGRMYNQGATPQNVSFAWTFPTVMRATPTSVTITGDTNDGSSYTSWDISLGDAYRWSVVKASIPAGQFVDVSSAIFDAEI
jgi:hypothetical protein